MGGSAYRLVCQAGTFHQLKNPIEITAAWGAGLNHGPPKESASRSWEVLVDGDLVVELWA